VGLRERVQLDGHVQRTGNLEDARRPVAVVGDLRVRGVMYEEYIVATAELDGVDEMTWIARGARRVAGIVQPQDACTCGVLVADRGQVGNESVIALHGDRHRRRADESRDRVV